MSKGDREWWGEDIFLTSKFWFEAKDSLTAKQSCPPSSPPSLPPFFSFSRVVVLKGNSLSIPEVLEEAMLHVAGEAFLQRTEGRGRERGREGGRVRCKTSPKQPVLNAREGGREKMREVKEKG